MRRRIEPPDGSRRRANDGKGIGRGDLSASSLNAREDDLAGADPHAVLDLDALADMGVPFVPAGIHPILSGHDLGIEREDAVVADHELRTHAALESDLVVDVRATDD